MRLQKFLLRIFYKDFIIINLSSDLSNEFRTENSCFNGKLARMIIQKRYDAKAPGGTYIIQQINSGAVL